MSVQISKEAGHAYELSGHLARVLKLAERLKASRSDEVLFLEPAKRALSRYFRDLYPEIREGVVLEDGWRVLEEIEAQPTFWALESPAGERVILSVGGIALKMASKMEGERNALSPRCEHRHHDGRQCGHKVTGEGTFCGHHRWIHDRRES